MSVFSLENSGMFTPWRDPITGVESWILTDKVAPFQQSFYYVNPSFSDDGRFLWFYCAFPPSGRLLAVCDFERCTTRIFPETEFSSSSPYVAPETAEVYWVTNKMEIWKRGPLEKDKAERVYQFPKDLIANRTPTSLATHLTRSANKKTFSIDARFGREWIVGDVLIDGNGEFSLWQSFDKCHTHAQFSPTDPDLMLIAQDAHFDCVTGEHIMSGDRLWLIRRGEKVKQILPNDPVQSAYRGHEWWDADGEHVWFIDYTEGSNQGTKKVNIHTGKVTTIWKHGHSHSHCDSTGSFVVGDIVSWPKDAWQVAFYNTLTGKEIAIVTQLPPCNLRFVYHVHPHPQFCLHDKYICYTTNVLGSVDIALVSVEHLLDLTQ